MNNITAADKKEMVSEARSYLRSKGIRATDRQVEAQIAAEHGRTVADQIARHLGMTPQAPWERLPSHANNAVARRS